MNDPFHKTLFKIQQRVESVPSNEEITGWAERLLCLLFPQHANSAYRNEEIIRHVLENLEIELVHILNATTACYDCDNAGVAREFFTRLPEIYRMLHTDVHALVEGDPAAHSVFEVIRAYPGFYALCFYRIAHTLNRLAVPL